MGRRLLIELAAPAGRLTCWKRWIVACVRRMPFGEFAAHLAAPSMSPAERRRLNSPTYSSSAPPSPRRPASDMASAWLRRTFVT